MKGNVSSRTGEMTCLSFGGVNVDIYVRSWHMKADVNEWVGSFRKIVTENGFDGLQFVGFIWSIVNMVSSS